MQLRQLVSPTQNVNPSLDIAPAFRSTLLLITGDLGVPVLAESQNL
jgi:hypothetical protein